MLRVNYGEVRMQMSVHGLMIEDLLDMNNLSVINTGQETYQHYDGSRSHLDVSVVSNCLAAKSN